ASWFRAEIRTADHEAIDAFLDHHGTLKPARELRYRYALHLAKAGKLEEFLNIYQAYYQGLEIARLDCIALHAELDAGRGDRIINRARVLWLTGTSQAEECDPVFEYLRAQNLLDDDDYRARYALAIDAREFTRARWLARSLDQSLLDQAGLWLQAQSNPERFIKTHGPRASDEFTRQRLAYAVECVTFADPEKALELWKSIEDAHTFSPDLRHATLRHIALWTARDDLPGAYELLTSLPLPEQDEEVMRWRARTSLRHEQWTDLLNDVAMMTADERDSEQWQYWRAVALQRIGNLVSAHSILETLANERSYYGFLAADELGITYSFEHDTLEANATMIDKMAAREDLVRARELFLVGLDGRGRSEWDAVIAYFSPEEKLQAAVLAGRWGWHSRAISTAASIGHYDDLTLRYPLPFRQSFEQHSSTASIPATWALGVARSESLFMRDARSSAGAIGLMQLMPSTGRKVAREIKLPYSGLDTLTDPHKNIRLGTTYLGNMAERYDGNRVLATAAYNAGPHRVDRWLPESGVIDARVWIENIPFNETRKYVRRVMAAETIFHWRLTGEVRRLSDELSVVQSPPEDQQLARR
ncbi:MAG: transglycosylase SLT domain-containing protein, partial [Woeseiaceae bacterium]|nr:transglycosylase SLT domain-containing protein [Woeseiaceae bacterium]